MIDRNTFPRDSQFSEPVENTYNVDGRPVVVEFLRDSVRIIELMIDYDNKTSAASPKFEVALQRVNPEFGDFPKRLDNGEIVLDANFDVVTEKKPLIPVIKPIAFRKYRVLFELKGLENALAPEQVEWSKEVKK